MRAGVSRADAFAAMLEGIRGKLAEGIMPLVNQFFGWFNSKALPRILEYLDYFTKVVLPDFQARWSKFYADNRVFMEEWLPKIVGIVFALGPVISILKGIAAAIGVIGTLIGSSILPVLLIAGAVYLLYTRFESVRTVVHSLWNNVLKPFVAGFIEGFLFVGEVFGNVFSGIWAQFSQVWADITSFFGTGTGDMATSAKHFGQFVGIVFGEIAQVIGLVVGGMVRIFRSAFGLVAGLIKSVAKFVRGDFEGAFLQFGDTLLKALLTPLNLFLGGLSSALDLIGIGSDTLNQWRNKAGDMDIGGLNAKASAALGLDTPQATKLKAKQKSIETNLQANSVASSGPLLSSMAVSMPSLSTRGAAANAGSTTPITGTSAGGTTLTINIDGRQFVKDIVVPQLNKYYNASFQA